LYNIKKQTKKYDTNKKTKNSHHITSLCISPIHSQVYWLCCFCLHFFWL